MFFTKLTEYSAYGAASSIFVIFLQQDVVMNGEPLGDTNGYLYYMIWGMVAHHYHHDGWCGLRHDRG